MLFALLIEREQIYSVSLNFAVRCYLKFLINEQVLKKKNTLDSDLPFYNHLHDMDFSEYVGL